MREEPQPPGAWPFPYPAKSAAARRKGDRIVQYGVEGPHPGAHSRIHPHLHHLTHHSTLGSGLTLVKGAPVAVGSKIQTYASSAAPPRTDSARPSRLPPAARRAKFPPERSHPTAKTGK